MFDINSTTYLLKNEAYFQNYEIVHFEFQKKKKKKGKVNSCAPRYLGGYLYHIFFM